MASNEFNSGPRTKDYQRRREVKFSEKQEIKSRKRSWSKSERRVGVAIPEGFVSNGSKKGIKRLQCKACKSSLNINKWEEHKCKEERK